MLSEYLKALKTKKNMSGAQIAQMSGVSESTISRLLKGESKGVDFATVLEVVRALGGSMDEACGFIHEAANRTKDGEVSSMDEDKIIKTYHRLIKEDLAAAYNARIAEMTRIMDQRIEREKEHYREVLAEKVAVYQQQADNLMLITRQKSKTIYRLFVMIGVLGIVTIGCLALLLFVPTGPIFN